MILVLNIFRADSVLSLNVFWGTVVFVSLTVFLHANIKIWCTRKIERIGRYMNGRCLALYESFMYNQLNPNASVALLCKSVDWFLYEGNTFLVG